ncbi:hypothetical protein [Nocardioides bruguierae]|uniref:hypothetical protein n=1 Tax=Nocardioides bruguierae TaxID=2945102 RepID=UPI0020207AD4|nr:hypothetical protein [Nocardioides bruguierae]MCL8026322.1 hypothetical protein [Nocardioides bruguierae]
MGLDDDADCVEHVWELSELRPTLRGMERVKVCGRCDAVAVQPGQAALRDTRPPL